MLGIVTQNKLKYATSCGHYRCNKRRPLTDPLPRAAAEERPKSPRNPARPAVKSPAHPASTGRPLPGKKARARPRSVELHAAGADTPAQRLRRESRGGYRNPRHPDNQYLSALIRVVSSTYHGASRLIHVADSTWTCEMPHESSRQRAG